MSVGGFFKRGIVDGAQKIVDVDFTEISATPVPVHPGTSLNVVGGKALEDLKMPKVPKVEGDIRDSDLEMIEYMVSGLEGIFNTLKKRGKPKPKDSFGGEPIL
jgi:hypothetical protein